MKIRVGFVSNSSSCSFLCEICAKYEEGYDIDAAQAGMYVCENYHEFCISHALRPITAAEEHMMDYSMYDHAPSELCPICDLKDVSNEMLVRYIFKHICKSITKEAVIDQIKENFATYKEFYEYVDGD